MVHPSLPHELSLANFAFQKDNGTEEGTRIQELIEVLGMQKHIEGGYFVETDRDPLLIPNPYLKEISGTGSSSSSEEDSKDLTRNASTSIFYLITPSTPIGYFHRNKGRTVHTLHQGRVRYVIIHADRPNSDGTCEVETVIVGRDLKNGETLQLIVEGGKFKSSFLLPTRKDEVGEVDCVECGGCLISEVSPAS